MNINEIDWQQVRLNIDAFEQIIENPELELQYYDMASCGWVKTGINTHHTVSAHDIISLKYHIKPEPQYRPYTEVKEEWIGKKVIPLNENTSRINTITDIDLTMNEVAVYSHWKTMYNMFENYIWGNNGDENDGKPFGKVME